MKDHLGRKWEVTTTWMPTLKQQIKAHTHPHTLHVLVLSHPHPTLSYSDSWFLSQSYVLLHLTYHTQCKAHKPEVQICGLAMNRTRICLLEALTE